MAEKIHIMDDSLSSKIAAGEVVERPASVVKELIENSIDAGADEIRINVNEGGIRLIKVADNGSGISPKDAALAFERHATSKLRSEEDLESINTMGFRGEALSSIASVASVTLKSRRPGDIVGTLVKAGVDKEPGETACAQGTCVEVSELFSKTPARLKFLKTPTTEFGRILEQVRRIAIAHPSIRFRLFHGSTKSLDTRKGKLSVRLRDIFGEDTFESLIELTGNAEALSGAGQVIRVSGFVGSPELSYPSSRHLYTYVNGRFVRDRAVNRAIIDAYSGMLDTGRYPFAAVNISMAPSEVDVNVHPAKTEVRFKDTSLVFNMVKGAITETLASCSSGRLARETGDKGGFGVERGSGYTGYKGAFVESRKGIKESRQGYGEFLTKRGLVGGFSQAETELHNGPYAEPRGQGPELLFEKTAFVGQLFGEYLVVEGEDEFILIDQHAAAERLLYERLKASYYGEGTVGSQYLLVPERVETTPEQKESLIEAEEDLKRLGFEITEFGPSHKEGGETFLVKAVPELLEGRSSASLIKDLSEELADTGSDAALKENMDSVLMRMACHGAVRGKRALTKEEAAALLNDLSKVDFSGHCPHGRPVAKVFTKAEIESAFKRR